jgi:hypothetical protein
MPRGHKPTTAPGPCATCGAAKVWKADSRRATGGYWTCSHKDAAPHAPRASTTPRQPSRRPSTVLPRPAIGTQAWLTDPTVRVCKADGCLFDSGTCRHARKR